MKIEILQPEFAEAYNQFLLNHRCSLFYYSSKYKDFLKTLQSDWVEICGISTPASVEASAAQAVGIWRTTNIVSFFFSQCAIIK